MQAIQFSIICSKISLLFRTLLALSITKGFFVQIYQVMNVLPGVHIKRPIRLIPTPFSDTWQLLSLIYVFNSGVEWGILIWTTDMLKLFFLHFFTLNCQIYIVTSCAHGLVSFRHKNHLVSVRKTSGFLLKYLVLSPQTQLESVPTSHSERNIQWFHAYKCWNTVLNSGLLAAVLSNCLIIIMSLTSWHDSELMYMLCDMIWHVWKWLQSSVSVNCSTFHTRPWLSADKSEAS